MQSLKIEALEQDISRLLSLMSKSREFRKLTQEIKGKHYIKGTLCGVKFNPEEIVNWVPEEILRIASAYEIDQKMLNPIILEMNKFFMERESKRLKEMENRFRGVNLSIQNPLPKKRNVFRSNSNKENSSNVQNRNIHNSNDFESGIIWGVNKALENHKKFELKMVESSSSLLQEFKSSAALLKINNFLVHLHLFRTISMNANKNLGPNYNCSWN